MVSTSDIRTGSPSTQSRRTVQVDVRVGLTDHTIQLFDVPAPVTLEYISECLTKQGFETSKAMVLVREELHVRVTEDASAYTFGYGGCINVDQPLLHFYHKCYLKTITDRQSSRAGHVHRIRSAEADPDYDRATISEKGTSINVGGVNISFHRTIRVPDNVPPPNCGAHTIYNVRDYDNIPESIKDRGGAFINMYPIQTMYFAFSLQHSFRRLDASAIVLPRAVKVSVGGINALTGLPRDAMQDSGPSKQDYLAINESNWSQLCLDGVRISPTEVRQFTPMSMGEGYTVEGQVTGDESIGEIQLDVYRPYSTTVSFKKEGSSLDLYQTPRQLCLKSGSFILMKDLIKRRAERVCPELEDATQIGFDVPGTHLNITVFSDISEYHYVLDLVDFDTVPRGVIGFRAARGRTCQQINQDPLPPAAYDQERGSRLHLTILDPTQFKFATERDPSLPPVSARMYSESGQLSYAMPDDYIPAAGLPQNSLCCRSCGFWMVTTRLRPCRDLVCDECAGDTKPVAKCPLCARCVRSREIIAAAMLLPGNEGQDGVEAKSLDKRIELVKLPNGGGLVVKTRILRAYRVSPLSAATD